MALSGTTGSRRVQTYEFRGRHTESVNDSDGPRRNAVSGRTRAALFSACIVGAIVAGLHMLSVGLTPWLVLCLGLLLSGGYAHYRAAKSGEAALQARLRRLERQRSDSAVDGAESEPPLPSVWTQLLWEIPAVAAIVGALVLSLWLTNG